MPKNAIDPDDPMQLHGVALATGDPSIMLEDVVDEFVRLGYGERELTRLFRDPHFQLTHALARTVGERAVVRAVRRGLARWGVPLDGPAAWFGGAEEDHG